ncbi:TIGR02453 family protein [Agromyces luteolus]|uniref:TIGR02453 family protein n=1 Tax=Agromyces luteolus TaxID=88373 RepID=A0A7C9LRB6_9MICO|nr:DUF2461 domain-containing protein [Agromyces luteolus]MUN05796.1 TIGR02453 family protein [Agromyces luteolus]GLK26345.1 TIGR02453 family protein [Agromyces luteolus]
MTADRLPDGSMGPGDGFAPDERLFPPEAFAFYAGLEADNSRDWWQAHRSEYERFVRMPLERLAAVAGERYGPAKVFRPNRDVRFSADKSPYKLNGAMTAGRVGGVYVSIAVEGLHAGGGLYEPSREQLQRAREAIAADGPAAAALDEVVRSIEQDGLELAGPFLKTAPRGFDRDHPRIRLLRLTHFAGLATLPAEATMADLDRVWRAVEPLLGWVGTHAEPAV